MPDLKDTLSNLARQRADNTRVKSPRGKNDRLTEVSADDNIRRKAGIELSDNSKDEGWRSYSKLKIKDK